MSVAKPITKSLLQAIDEAVKPLLQRDEHDKPWDEMTDGAKELALYGENTGHLYTHSYMPCIDSLKRKIKNGSYDRTKVPQLMKYHADRVADSYAKEHGSRGDTGKSMFTPDDRKQAAHYFASTAHEDAHDR